MASEYYTPTIEEFHVGFEYEVKWNEEKVIPYTFPNYPRAGIDWGPIKDRIAIIENLLSSKDKVRVKYLDKEDIESLGFEYQDGKMIKGYSDNFIYKPNNNLQYNLTYVYAKNILRIHVEDLVYFEESYNYLYQGTIKNKSELNKLLKMLGIL